MLTLYHARTSVCAIKVRLVLSEKKLSWDSILLALNGDQFDPAYLRINPNAVVPTLAHDGRVIADSTVIMHYIDEAFPDVALMPSDPLMRARVRVLTKFIDEYVHNACTLLSFATANRPRLLALGEELLALELAKIPERAAREAKAQAAKYGLDGPAIADALSHMRKLLDLIAEAVRVEDYIGGTCYSIADAAAIPYIWRLEMLRLFPLWADRPEISEWYRRMRERPSFAWAVDTWMRAADFARYADLADPWPKIREIVALQSGDPVNRSDHGYSKSGA